MWSSILKHTKKGEQIKSELSRRETIRIGIEINGIKNIKK